MSRLLLVTALSLGAGCVMEFGELDAGPAVDGGFDPADARPIDPNLPDAAPLTEGLSTLAGSDEPGFENGGASPNSLHGSAGGSDGERRGHQYQASFGGMGAGYGLGLQSNLNGWVEEEVAN